MAACPDYEVLLDLHAAGALEAGEAARVGQHVTACDGCREALASTVAVLGLAALPPLDAREKAVVEELPARTLAAWRRDAGRRGLGRRTLGALVAAAAGVALILLVPGVARNPGAGDGTGETPAAPTAEAEVDAETMAAIEAWAGLEPLDEAPDAPADGDALEDEDPDMDLGETL